MNRKYLAFLDIDGVLTGDRVHFSSEHEYNMWHQFDPVAIQFFNRIHDQYPVEWVIMSTWKNQLRNDDTMIEHWIRAAFANCGFRGVISSPWKTDPDNFASTKYWDRAHEVKDYLENFGQDIQDFILFDDNTHRFKEILGKSRLIRTDPVDGLLFKHMKDAWSLMGNWHER